MANPTNSQKMDQYLDRIYGYHGTPENPPGVSGQVWALPKRSCCFPWVSNATNNGTNEIEPGETYFLHYFQSQGYGPTDNECVTTSALICMNILTEWIAAVRGTPVESKRHIQEYTDQLDRLGLPGWQYRFSTHSPLPGMMHPFQAIHALRDHAKELQARYGKSYKVNLMSGCSVNDLVNHLRQGRLILLHGAWQIKLGSANSHLAYMGGMPHTMVLVGYDAGDQKWLFLNPGDPWPASKNARVSPKFYRMRTADMMNFWGRHFLFYPPRFSITILMLEE